MRALLRRLRRDRDGIVTIELAMWSSTFFMIMLGALDFGMWRTYQLRLGSAVEQGAMLVLNNAAAFDATQVTPIQNYVKAAAGLPGGAAMVGATIVCNGNAGVACTATNRPLVCLTDAVPAQYQAPVNNSCSSRANTTPGYYATLTATFAYQPTVLPRGMLANQTITESVTVRLQ